MEGMVYCIFSARYWLNSFSLIDVSDSTLGTDNEITAKKAVKL